MMKRNRDEYSVDISVLPPKLRAALEELQSNAAENLPISELIFNCFGGGSFFASSGPDVERTKLFLEIVKKKKIGWKTIEPLFENYLNNIANRMNSKKR